MLEVEFLKKFYKTKQQINEEDRQIQQLQNKIGIEVYKETSTDEMMMIIP